MTSSDVSKALKGTNVVSYSGGERRPPTRKRKQKILAESIDGLAKYQEKSFLELSGAIQQLATNRTKRDAFAASLDRRGNMIEQKISHVDSTLLKILEKLG